ncbi:hypothetical protein P171DRAFT_484369 [Karstenula rhodostoma CBS 690.94]|uniref:Thioredoxin domain-containing protein n=1 Tax=Karstenula rhodostoma CBS 690.94 TaxID=1392251 RepID=A0A9P4UE02_9PLEO|nr:hypothetical protein P171DRAFT_484369 [Karstenula rhodostoma CBS 690.94]
MSWQTELQSCMSPTSVQTANPPDVGEIAPSSSRLTLPAQDGKPLVLTFLRHCGCPFAEKTFLNMRSAASRHKHVIHFVAVSHSDRASTDQWLASLPQSSENSHVAVIVDDEREIYAQWGLGVSSFWHVLNPWSLFSVYMLGRQDGIYNRPTKSGTRWQTSGSFAVDGKGKVAWSKPSASADEVPDFEDVLNSLGT